METKYHKLINLIDNQSTAMLTTKQNDNLLKSRPMGISEVNEDGSIWFFSNENSCKANEIEEHPQVNLSITDSKEKIFVSISGRATIHRDKEKMKKLMNPMVKAWFPEGIDDPNISLIRVEMEKGAYWTGEDNKMTQLFEIGKALVKGEKADVGEHESVDV